MRKTPTERLLECADEAIALWSVAEAFVDYALELAREAPQSVPPAVLTKLGLIASALALRQPVNSLFHKRDLTSGDRAKNNERMRRFRAGRAVKALAAQFTPISEAECCERWLACSPSGGEFWARDADELFNRYKAKIVALTNAAFVKIPPTEDDVPRAVAFAEIFKEITYLASRK
jgi:hypothetical protein